MSIQRTIWLGLGVLLVLALLIVGSGGNTISLVDGESAKAVPPLTPSAASSAVQTHVRSRAVAKVSPAPLSATQKRRALFDSPNVLDAVRNAQANGSPDEKGWAAQLLMECYAYIQKEQQLYQSTEAPAVESKRMAAFEALQKRCHGVQELDWAARRAISAELAAAASASTSPLQILKALQDRHERGDTRWNQAESTLVTEALYGNDPLMKRQGFLALLTAIDEKAPGGRERRDGLLFALADRTLNSPLSEFERLQQCAAAAMCGQVEPVPEAIPGRLQSLYEAAFAQRASPEALLAIR